jgi:uncharacterized protein (DUF924 family)/predicted ester cyclase
MPEEDKTVVRRVVEEFLTTGDPHLAEELFAPSYADHSASHPNLAGIENVKKSTEEWLAAFPDSRNVVEDVIAEGDRVAARWTTRATHEGEFAGISPTGKPVEVAWFAIFRLSDGKIAESWDTYSPELLKQLGARPSGLEPQQVLDFWFGVEGEPGYGEFRQAWFTKDPAFDEEIRERFLEGYTEAAAGGYDSWMDEARGALALAILLDQFPRNMFRGDAQTHATDEKAREVARHAIERALDRELPPFQRQFLYMPFMHSEDLEDQRRSVELFRFLATEPGAADVTEYAVGHMEIVERFGRFPHRNAILGRETTPEEAKFLEGPNSSF